MPWRFSRRRKKIAEFGCGSLPPRDELRATGQSDKAAEQFEALAREADGTSLKDAAALRRNNRAAGWKSLVIAGCFAQSDGTTRAKVNIRPAKCSRCAAQPS